MGVYIVTLPEGAYTTQDGSNSRLVVADNSTDAIAMAKSFSASDGAPWANATAVLCAGPTDFSGLTFSVTVTHDSDNGLGADKTFSYQPLSTDAIADIGAGLAAAAVAAGLAGVNYYTTGAVYKVQLPAGLNCGKSVITSHAPVWQPAAIVNSSNVTVHQFDPITLTGTSVKPTMDAASGSTVALARYLDLAPLLTGINPAALAELRTFY